jgi:hypothetical protein
MIFHFTGSLTGVAYIFLSFAMGFLALRFYQYQKQRKDTVSKCFFYFALSFFAFALVKAITGLFFANGLNVLMISSFFSSFLEGLAAAIVAYLIIKIKFPKVSPWLGFWIIFLLGITTLIMNIIVRPSVPHIDQSGAISWSLTQGIIPIIYYILRMAIILVSFVPLIFILIQQASSTANREAKYRAIGLAIVAFLGIIIGLIDFVFVKVFGVNAISRDITMGILSILLFFVVFFTQKPPSAEKNNIRPGDSPWKF